MGLHFNSGPKWKDDTLNDLNIESIEDNAREMYHRWPNGPDYFTKTDVKGIVSDLHTNEIKRKQAEMVQHPSKALKRRKE
jgi:hypothetical protein